MTSLLSLLGLHVHNLLLITRCDDRPVPSNEPQAFEVDGLYVISALLCLFIYFLRITQLLVRGETPMGSVYLWSLISDAPVV